MTFRDTNGRELLFDGEFAMTKQAVSFNNGSIKGDVSVTFQLDNNSINREILNYKGPLMINQVAFTKQPFDRVNNGNILDSGYIVIQSEDDRFLKCFYVSGNSNWLQLLEGLITELDFSGVTNGKNYVKQFNRTNVIATSTEGIVFPFIDWCFAKKKGNNTYLEANYNESWVDVNNDLNFPLIQFYPCFFVHSLASEIFNQAGIKKEGNLFQDQLYKSLALPPVNGLLKRDAFKKVLLNGSSQTYSGGAGVYEKIKGLTLRQSDPTTWDDINKRFITPIQCISYVYVTMTDGPSNNQRIRIRKNSALLSAVQTVQLGIKKRFVLSNLFTSENPGDYFEIETTNTVTSPFNASFDIEFEIPENVLANDYINPNNFLPAIQSIDIIKFLINFFGCAVHFDSTSKTITITVIDRLKIEDSYDWSKYYISHSTYYVENAAHNFINWLDSSPDTIIKKYNQTHTLKFGDGDIQTSNSLLDQKQISELPFEPSASDVSYNGVYSLNIPLINLIDDGEPILFTGMGLDSAGPPTRTFFTTGTGVDGILHPDEVVRITNSDGENLGYYAVWPGPPATNGETILFPFISTDSGKIWRQKIEYQQLSPRIISIKSGASVSEFSPYTLYGNGFTATLLTTINYATFTKNLTNLPIDQWKNNLAIDNPDSGNFIDPTIKELYFNKISRFIENPKVRAMMRLPDSVYQKFKFDQFIYLKTEKLTGYFFVESIENYVDSNTPVEVNLYML
jgi:hypothetical protein